MVTLIIATRNRWPFLKRLLTYYAAAGLTIEMIIGDSSDQNQEPLATEALSAVSGRLSIRRVLYPDTSNLACIRSLLDQVETPYVVWAADDDFITPNGIDQAVSFLTDNPDYIAAHGRALLFTVAEDQANGQLTGVFPYRQRSLEHESAARRLVDHFRHYSPTIYSVHRTEALRDAYTAIVDLKLDHTFGELLPSGLPVIRGKVKKLDVLYMVRQAHADMTSRKLNPDPFDWICRPSWPEQYERFCRLLTEEVLKKESISAQQAREVVKKALWAYLAVVLKGKWRAPAFLPAKDSARMRVSTAARQIPLLKKTWHAVRSFLPGETNRASLSALMRPSSSDHKEFMPIYQTIASNSDIPRRMLG